MEKYTINTWTDKEKSARALRNIRAFLYKWEVIELFSTWQNDDYLFLENKDYNHEEIKWEDMK